MTPRHGRVSRPLGAVDALLAVMSLLTLLLSVVIVYALRESECARRTIRSELWDAGIALENAEELAADRAIRLADAELRVQALAKLSEQPPPAS